MTRGRVKIVYFSFEEDYEKLIIEPFSDFSCCSLVLSLRGAVCGPFQIDGFLQALKWVGSQPHQEPAGRLLGLEPGLLLPLS